MRAKTRKEGYTERDDSFLPQTIEEIGMTHSAPKSKVAAALLCFFIGALGVHRFYLGYTGIGLAQLFTCGGCGIWALIDFIMILTDSLKDSSGRDLV